MNEIVQGITDAVVLIGFFAVLSITTLSAYEVFAWWRSEKGDE